MVNMMQPINMQILNLKLQMNNVQSQFGNIENQMLNGSMTFIGEQMQNLGIQMINIGIQILNISIQSSKLNMNIINFKQQIKNIQMQIQNIEMNIPSIPNSNPFFQIQNIGNNELFNNNFNMNFEGNNDYKVPKINIIFSHTSRIKKVLHFNNGTTVNDIMERYLKEIGKSDFINTDNVVFLYNAVPLKFGDNTKIEFFFRYCLPHPPTLTVSDTYGHSLF